MDTKTLIGISIAFILILFAGWFGWMLRGSKDAQNHPKPQVVTVRDSIAIDSLKATLRPIAAWSDSIKATVKAQARTTVVHDTLTNKKLIEEFNRVLDQYHRLLSDTEVLRNIIAEADTSVRTADASYDLHMSYSYGDQTFSHRLLYAKAASDTAAVAPSSESTFWNTVLQAAAVVAAAVIGYLIRPH